MQQSKTNTGTQLIFTTNKLNEIFAFFFQSTHPLIRTSQVSLSSNPDADFRYSNIFTPIGLYKGQLYSIKKVRKKSIDITREMKMELKMVNKSLIHSNIHNLLSHSVNEIQKKKYSFVL